MSQKSVDYDTKAYAKLKKTEPKLKCGDRLKWLLLKKHFGPVTVAEEEEIRKLKRQEAAQ